MGRYGEVVESGEVSYRGLTYTYEIYPSDDAENPLDGMDDPGIWIHDNATRSWGGLAKGDSIWDAIGGDSPYEKHEYGVEEAYELWANRRFQKWVKSGVDNRAAYRDAFGIDSIVEFFERETGGIARVLYGYEHSGQAISLAGFNDRWDSGAIGIVYMTPAMIRDRMLWKRITKKRREEMIEHMASDIRVIDNWLHGYTYGYVFYDEHGKEPKWNSLWGCYDDWDAKYTISEATDAIKSHIDGRYLDIDIRRVERLAASTGMALARAAVTDDTDVADRMMHRLMCATERIPAWRRTEIFKAATSAYDHGVTHPVAWDVNLTTEYGSIV